MSVTPHSTPKKVLMSSLQSPLLLSELFLDTEIIHAMVLEDVESLRTNSSFTPTSQVLQDRVEVCLRMMECSGFEEGLGTMQQVRHKLVDTNTGLTDFLDQSITEVEIFSSLEEWLNSTTFPNYEFELSSTFDASKIDNGQILLSKHDASVLKNLVFDRVNRLIREGPIYWGNCGLWRLVTSINISGRYLHDSDKDKHVLACVTKDIVSLAMLREEHEVMKFWETLDFQTWALRESHSKVSSRSPTPSLAESSRKIYFETEIMRYKLEYELRWRLAVRVSENKIKAIQSKTYKARNPKRPKLETPKPRKATISPSYSPSLYEPLTPPKSLLTTPSPPFTPTHSRPTPSPSTPPTLLQPPYSYSLSRQHAVTPRTSPENGGTPATRHNIPKFSDIPGSPFFPEHRSLTPGCGADSPVSAKLSARKERFSRSCSPVVPQKTAPVKTHSPRKVISKASHCDVRWYSCQFKRDIDALNRKPNPSQRNVDYQPDSNVILVRIPDGFNKDFQIFILDLLSHTFDTQSSSTNSFRLRDIFSEFYERIQPAISHFLNRITQFVDDMSVFPPLSTLEGLSVVKTRLVSYIACKTSRLSRFLERVVKRLSTPHAVTMETVKSDLSKFFKILQCACCCDKLVAKRPGYERYETRASITPPGYGYAF